MSEQRHTFTTDTQVAVHGKRRLIAAAQERWPSVEDDNEADACFVGLAALAKGTGA